FVLLLDIDHFREINERLGFAGGDQLLTEVAIRLKRRLRASDTVARFGADEFAVLLSRVQTGQDVARVAERLQGELSAPFQVQGFEVVLWRKPPAAGETADGKGGVRRAG